MFPIDAFALLILILIWSQCNDHHSSQLFLVYLYLYRLFLCIVHRLGCTADHVSCMNMCSCHTSLYNYILLSSTELNYFNFEFILWGFNWTLEGVAELLPQSLAFMLVSNMACTWMYTLTVILCCLWETFWREVAGTWRDLFSELWCTFKVQVSAVPNGIQYCKCFVASLMDVPPYFDFSCWWHWLVLLVYGTSLLLIMF